MSLSCPALARGEGVLASFAGRCGGLWPARSRAGLRHLKAEAERRQRGNKAAR
jgi:hypothetical protein